MSVPFYSRPSLHVEIYDTQTETGWGPQNDIAFYLEEARASGGPVLELCCGTGRLTLPLLDLGLEIHGLDLNEAMLDMAKQKRSRLSDESAARLHLHHGDVREFQLNQKFALIFIPFRSFQILATPEAQRRSLTCIRKHLRPGGKVIINLFDPRYEFMLPGKQEKSFAPPREFVHPITGNRVLVETVERVNDPLSQTFQERWRFTEFDATGAILRQEEESLCLRWTFRYEMRHLLESCGFAIEAEYSNFHRSPPAYGKEQVWIFKSA